MASASVQHTLDGSSGDCEAEWHLEILKLQLAVHAVYYYSNYTMNVQGRQLRPIRYTWCTHYHDDVCTKCWSNILWCSVYYGRIYYHLVGHIFCDTDLANYCYAINGAPAPQ